MSFDSFFSESEIDPAEVEAERRHLEHLRHQLEAKQSFFESQLDGFLLMDQRPLSDHYCPFCKHRLIHQLYFLLTEKKDVIFCAKCQLIFSVRPSS